MDKYVALLAPLALDAEGVLDPALPLVRLLVLEATLGAGRDGASTGS